MVIGGIAQKFPSSLYDSRPLFYFISKYSNQEKRTLNEYSVEAIFLHSE